MKKLFKGFKLPKFKLPKFKFQLPKLSSEIVVHVAKGTQTSPHLPSILVAIMQTCYVQPLVDSRLQ